MAILAENRKARFDYEILETFEAGLVLNGQEVKSAKAGRMQIAGSHVSIRGGEAYLAGSSIPPYQPINAPSDYAPERNRKLLLRKHELSSLLGKSAQMGLTIIPLKVYTLKGNIKLEIALARGKKKHDKRQVLKRREHEREIRKHLRLS
ncbi:MAG: SsrA-binding protein SmpB [Candidatus Yanofskybacteria bacterium]|nr:SsrA-binding protein SmpB [Candidatus Yanofskybacteria bacterium]